MIKKILIINGPNLNLLGDREESKYGKTTLEELKKTVPQLFDASKRVNGFIFGLVGNRELSNESKSWMSFLLSLAIKSVQIQFSTETRF